MRDHRANMAFQRNDALQTFRFAGTPVRVRHSREVPEPEPRGHLARALPMCTATLDASPSAMR